MSASQQKRNRELVIENEKLKEELKKANEFKKQCPANGVFGCPLKEAKG